jgi:hypothetical protein
VLARPREVTQQPALDDLAVPLGEQLQDPDVVECQGVRSTIPGDTSQPRLEDPVAEPKPDLEVVGVHDHST